MKNTAKIILTLLFVFIVLVFLFSGRNQLRYTLSAEEVLLEIIKEDYDMSPREANEISVNKEKTTVFIDLRDPVLYDNGHLDQAVNIPSGKLLDRHFMKMLRNFHDEGLTMVLYGQDHREAVGPFLFLRQTGFNRLKILTGGYDYFQRVAASGNGVEELPERVSEEPRYDFAALIEEIGGAPGQVQQAIAQPVIPVRREKTTTIQGGC
ncbi:MAG TPA: rhodanese-like domain-containing protein [Bacteroidetes bacterium]|nr:rhodanese-like domain-containing protein [Bacteroidota bacterium]